MLYIGALTVLHFYGDSYEPGTQEYLIASAASWALIVLISLSALMAVFAMFWGAFGHYFKFKEKERLELERKLEEEKKVEEGPKDILAENEIDFSVFGADFSSPIAFGIGATPEEPKVSY